MKNEMYFEFLVFSQNELFVCVMVVFFIVQLDLMMDELMEIKIVVLEVVINVIIYGYEENCDGKVYIFVMLEDYVVYLIIWDEGFGIMDLEEVCQLFFMIKFEFECFGMGFIIMENFMDDVMIDFLLEMGMMICLIKYLLKSKVFCN